MIVRNCLNTSMLIQCILDVLYTIVSLVELVEILCLFINVLDVQKHFIRDAWTKKKLLKFQKNNSSVNLISKIKKT
jgi:hypothetical protein